MKLPNPVRAGFGAVQAHLPPLRPPTIEEIKRASDRAPAQIVSATVRGVELGVTGYAALVRVGLRATDLVTAAVGSAVNPRARTRSARGAPVHDPWTGGPLQPVDDIRDALLRNREDAATVELVPPGDTLSHDELPLADYDHLTLGELRARIRQLGVAELVQLREYEHAHADRLPVVKAFDTRLATLAKKSAAQEPVPAP
jgi:hypothetical protein